MPPHHPQTVAFRTTVTCPSPGSLILILALAISLLAAGGCDDPALWLEHPAPWRVSYRPAKCQSNADCASDFTCHPKSRTCLPLPDAMQQCPAGHRFMAPHFCEPLISQVGGCREGVGCAPEGVAVGCMLEDLYCPEGMFCDAQSRRCRRPGRCGPDSACPPGFICSAVHQRCYRRCRKGPKPGAAVCSDGEYCSEVSRHCSPLYAPCRDDSHCEEGQACLRSVGLCRLRCEWGCGRFSECIKELDLCSAPRYPCTVDRECPVGGKCVDGLCRMVCASGGGCPPYQQCDQARGACLPKGAAGGE